MHTIPFVVGRFQPFHNGHVSLINFALAEAKDAPTVIFIGSSNSPGDERNPFNFYKRVDMITKSFTREQLAKIIVMPLPDFEDNDEWVEHINHCLVSVSEKYRLENVKHIAVVCDKDDATTESNNLFEGVGNSEILRVNNPTMLHATDIRKMLFEDKMHPQELKHLMPYSTISVIEEFIRYKRRHDDFVATVTKSLEDL